MYTLDIKKNRIIYIAVTLFCFVFSYVYEMFSHEVYSLYMICPGVVTLVLGIVVIEIIKKHMSRISYNIYNSLVATIVVGMYVKGVLDIYGTTNELIVVYLYVSIALFISFIVSMLVGKHE